MTRGEKNAFAAGCRVGAAKQKRASRKKYKKAQY